MQCIFYLNCVAVSIFEQGLHAGHFELSCRLVIQKYRASLRSFIEDWGHYVKYRLVMGHYEGHLNARYTRSV